MSIDIDGKAVKTPQIRTSRNEDDFTGDDFDSDSMRMTFFWDRFRATATLQMLPTARAIPDSPVQGKKRTIIACCRGERNTWA
jgi:hypothetical protein